jgi:hypothetical protein
MLPRETGKRLGQRGIMFRINLGYLRRTGRFELDLEALDALRSGAGFVIAPNHPALLDVMLVVSRLPRITCIMRAELWNDILLGGGARLARHIRNHSPRSMVKLAVEEIGRARRAGVPVQTVFIETDSPFLGKGWQWWRRPRFPVRYQVRLSRRFMVDGDARAFSAMLEA